MDNKILKLKTRFPQEAANFLILNSTNITYFTGFSGATALLIPQDGESTLYVSGTNFEQAKHEVKNAKIEKLKRGEKLFQKISQDAKVSANAKLAVDGISIESWKVLAKTVGDENNLVAASNVVRNLRSVKTPDEVELIRSACVLADVGINTAYEVIEPGVSEQEVAAEVEYAMRKKGSSGTAFDTIISSGANCAFPHGTCKCRTIMDGDLVVVDLGATVGNYRSDITRTITAGKISSKQQEIYGTVKAAQDLAIKSSRAGVKAVEVDATARAIISGTGFGDYFVHNLGHGVGLEVHEAPILSPDSKDTLEAGNVVTVEPGIYIVGFGGVRIEDTVLVTEFGAEKLTNAPYTLQSQR
ncbi:MAG: M24 family metallopeptidase [Candidatus Bathyarchaeia archaeon]|jgi:Xaa-Pro dipeptidase